MKYSPLLYILLLIFLTSVSAQNPADELDFGKIKVKNSELVWKTFNNENFTFVPLSQYKIMTLI